MCVGARCMVNFKSEQYVSIHSEGDRDILRIVLNFSIYKRKYRAACRRIEVLNVKVGVSILLLFASLPDCSQNQTAVSDTLRLLSDF